MKRAVGYMRVSTEEQGKSGFGLRSQKATIRAVAKASGYDLGRIYEEVGRQSPPAPLSDPSCKKPYGRRGAADAH
jgi:hypothetical protein